MFLDEAVANFWAEHRPVPTYINREKIASSVEKLNMHNGDTLNFTYTLHQGDLEFVMRVVTPVLDKTHDEVTDVVYGLLLEEERKLLI